MSNLIIGMIVGSLCKVLFNCQLVQVLVGLLLLGVMVQFIEIGELLFYNQDLDVSLFELVQCFKVVVVGVDFVLFVMLEYNCGILGVLKNVIDWGLWLYGQSVWGGKLVGIVGVLLGVIGMVLLQV